MKMFLIVLGCGLFAGVCAAEAHAHGHNHKPGEMCTAEKHKAHDHKEHAHEHQPGEACTGGGEGKSVEVAQAIQKVMGLKTVHPEKRRLQSTVSFTGRFELTPDARSTVATPVAGRLTILVKALARVRKGEALFTVESPDLSARAREIAILEKRLAVYKEIGTTNAQLESDLSVKKAERAALIGNALIATASPRDDGIVTVCAKADGMVESLPSESGAWVETGAPVIRLVRPEALQLKALVAASDAARLSEGLKAMVDGNEGHIHFGVGDESGLVPVYVLFPKGVKGRAGTRATVECVTDETEHPVMTVPTRAIVRIGLQPTVFIRDGHDANRFIAVNVVPGLSNAGWTEVKGLPHTDHLDVVVEGAYELKLALPSGSSAPAGHFHADGTFHTGEH